MSGIIHKIKDALHGDKSHNPDAPLANEHGSQSGVHDESTSVAHGSSISPTNPGVLHSTQHGIHGERDPGTGTSLATSGDDSRLTGSSVGDSSSKAAMGDGSSMSTTNRAAPDTTTTSTTGGSAGPQFTGDNTRDTDLVGSGLTSSGAKTSETGAGMAGTGYDERNRDPTLGGAGGMRGTGTGTALGGDTNTRDLTGTTTTGSGLGTNSARGEGLGDQSTTTTSTTAGSGFGGMGTDSSFGDSSNATTGRGLGSSTTGTGSGISGDEGRYVEGSERHHHGDGHPEDIVHPGPHVTGAAKALDPHFD